MPQNDANDTFTALISDDRHAVPTLVLYVGLDAEAARELVLTDLRANPHHLAIEVRAEDELVFAVRREDLEIQSPLALAG